MDYRPFAVGYPHDKITNMLVSCPGQNNKNHFRLPRWQTDYASMLYRYLTQNSEKKENETIAELKILVITSTQGVELSIAPSF